MIKLERLSEKEIIAQTFEPHENDAEGYCYKCVELVAQGQLEQDQGEAEIQALDWMIEWIEENSAREVDEGTWYCIPERRVQSLKDKREELKNER